MNRRMYVFTIAVLLASATCFAGAMYDEPPISYSTAIAHDPVAKLKERISTGQTKLVWNTEHGYLESVLHELKISTASQSLVFSKTSFQRTRISPDRPRALYFDDETYVGYVPGGDVLEIATTDPKLGTVFYTVDQKAPQEKPMKLARQTDTCLECHGDSMTRDVPGLLMRSVFADRTGNPIGSAGTFLTSQESPMKERWGGWYVTGSVAEPHMGNMRWEEREGQDPAPMTPPKADLAAYLSPHSDVVALMVLAHQTEAHNRMTHAAYDTLRALRDEKIVNDAMGEHPKPGEHSESTMHRIAGGCEPLVEYLLFSQEARLTAPLCGDSKFAAEFQAQGPRDRPGRSLRDFDLKTRLFKYPCSYLIYSSAMDGLPDAAKEYIQRRLWEVLSGKDSSKPFAHLSAEDRRATMEILRETKPDLRDAWDKLAHQPNAAPAAR